MPYGPSDFPADGELDERGVETTQADKDFDERNEVNTTQPLYDDPYRDEQRRVAALQYATGIKSSAVSIEDLLANAGKIDEWLKGDSIALDTPSD